jgi:cupin 2 domain-containing protein
MLNKKNIFEMIPEKLEQEIIELLHSSNSIRIERIISDNHSSPDHFWYDQKENEFVIVLKGEGTILFESGSKYILRAGDYLFIPAHSKHRVESTSQNEKTIWLAIFFPCD